VKLKQRGPLAVGLVGAGLILALLLGLIMPKAGQIKTRQRHLDQAKQQQASLAVQLEQLRAVAERAPENRRRLSVLRAAVPEVADLPGMIELVNVAAADADVDFMSVAPGQPTSAAGSKVSLVPTQITVLGRYFAIDEFLRRLENLPRISKVMTVALTQGPRGLPQLAMNLTAEFYTTDVSAGPGSTPGHTSALPVPKQTTTTSTTSAPGA
jgi:Tfp pilus assembly protein PilO